MQGKHLRQLNGYVRKLAEAEQQTEVDRWISRHRLKLNGAVFAQAVLTNGRRWWIYNTPEDVNGRAALTYPPPLEFDLLDASNLDAVISAFGKKELCAKVDAFLQRRGATPETTRPDARAGRSGKAALPRN